MIKINNVIYRTRTQEEYDWLMEKLEAAGCEWSSGEHPSDYDKNWILNISDYCIWVNEKIILFSNVEYFYDDYKDTQNYEIIEVSDLMESEKKTEILDKLEILNEHLEDELKKIEKGDDEQQKIKKIVYTTEVYFE